MNLAQRLPNGFQTRQAGNITVAALPEYLDHLASADISSLPTAGRGRGTLRRLALPNGTSLLIRRYRRGGVFRAVNKEKYFSPYRPLDEIRICREAAARGVPVARAVGAIVEARPPFWLCSLATEEIKDVIDLGEYALWLPAAPTREIMAEKREIIEAVGKAVRKMHDAGLYHADLQVKNIMVRRSTTGVEVFFVDLDKSVIKDQISLKSRVRNLRRLNRSMMKMRLDPPPIDDDDRRRFLKAYRSGDTMLGEDLSALLRSCRRHAALHSLSWRVFK